MCKFVAAAGSDKMPTKQEAIIKQRLHLSV